MLSAPAIGPLNRDILAGNVKSALTRCHGELRGGETGKRGTYHKYSPPNLLNSAVCKIAAVIFGLFFFAVHGIGPLFRGDERGLYHVKIYFDHLSGASAHSLKGTNLVG